MTPSDIVGAENIVAARPVAYSSAATAPTVAFVDGLNETRVVSPLDASDQSESPTQFTTPHAQDFAPGTFDDPTFGKVMFSAGAGAVLIAVQAERPAESETVSTHDPKDATAIYRFNQLLMGPPVAMTVSAPRQTVTEPSGFWWSPMREPLPMAA